MAALGIGRLASMCRRMGTSYEAGIDLRDVWRREAVSSHSPAFLDIEQQINAGHALGDAVKARQETFPQLFCEMVDLGEQTGRLGQTFLKLAEHYEQLVRLRRTFLTVIFWPVIQLSLAVLVIGLLIFVLKMIADVDLLGLGLSAGGSLGVYALFVLSVAGAIALAFRAVTKGWLGSWPLALAYRIPGVGGGLQMMSLSRMAWSMSMANDAGTDPHRMMQLAVTAGGSVYYGPHLPQIQQDLTQGRPIYEALAVTGAFPRDFLDSVETGERTGMLAESMSHLAESYREQAKSRNGAVALLMGVAIWVLIAVLIITVIFYLFQTLYLGPIQDALKPI